MKTLKVDFLINEQDFDEISSNYESFVYEKNENTINCHKIGDPTEWYNIDELLAKYTQTE